MPKVIVLADHIASQIAAGEVVERPASVVKELVENAVDAGATKIEVAVSADVRDIRIADDGCGMAPEDAVLAFHRHATSKLKSVDDLWKLTSLGFRGEALPSIASVAKVTCYTRTHDGASGHKIEARDGQVSSSEAGCSPGTIMEVTDLFYNVPARLSFLKKATTEFGHIQEIMQALAIAYLNVSFHLIDDGDTVFRTTGQGDLAQAIKEVRLFAGKDGKDAKDRGQLREVYLKDGSVEVSGLIARPLHFRGDRKGILTIVNNRPVRCPLTYKALDYAFSDLIPRGRYPLAAIKVNVDPSTIDINIHPTKKEIKYSNANEVYLTVQRAVMSALREIREQRSFAPEPSFEQARHSFEPGTAHPVEQSWQNACEPPLGKQSLDRVSGPSFEPSSNPSHTATQDHSLHRRDSSDSTVRNERGEVEALPFDRHAQRRFDDSGRSAGHGNSSHYSVSIVAETGTVDSQPCPQSVEQLGFRESLAYSPQLQAEAGQEEPGSVSNAAESGFLSQAGKQGELDAAPAPQLPAGWRIAGYLHNTYILVETSAGMEIIEQHIAHERTLYERLLSRQTTTGRICDFSQTLLISQPLTLTREQQALLRDNVEILRKFGFEFELEPETGEPDTNGVSCSQVPLELAHKDYAAAIHDLLEQIATADSANLELEATKSIACQSAIKNGMPLGYNDMVKLISEWCATPRNDTCPHGRPVKLGFSKDKLFQMFHPA